MNPHYQRALLLYDQSRHELAEEQLRLALADDPDDASAHGLLALCLAERQEFELATAEARVAVHQAPDDDFSHYVLARVFLARDREREALAAILEAIRLDGSDPDYFATLAAIHFGARRWPQALEAAEHGLQLDSEHIGCSNLRAMALVKLGRRAEAGETIDLALAKDPQNALTHANQGWTLLEAGEARQALEHFREALRLDPNNDWARAGIVEALKAQNVVYALVLRYFLWMSKLSTRAQWLVLLGAVFANRALGSLARRDPDLAPFFQGLRILLVAAIVMTWTADPLFNLMLRLNRFGRLVLTREQTVASNWFGSCVLAALVCLAAWLFLGRNPLLLRAALVFGILMVPVAGTFHGHPGWPRRTLAAGTVVIALMGMASFAVPALGGGAGVADAAFGFFLLGAIAFTWLANLVNMRRPRR